MERGEVKGGMTGDKQLDRGLRMLAPKEGTLPRCSQEENGQGQEDSCSAWHRLPHRAALELPLLPKPPVKAATCFTLGGWGFAGGRDQSSASQDGMGQETTTGEMQRRIRKFCSPPWKG